MQLLSEGTKRQLSIEKRLINRKTSINQWDKIYKCACRWHTVQELKNQLVN